MTTSFRATKTTRDALSHLWRQGNKNMDNPWLGFFLELYMASQAVVVFCSYACLTGSTKFSSRIYLGIFVTAIPGILVGLCTYFMRAKNNQIRWDFYAFSVSGAVSYVIMTFLSIVFVARHGSKTGLQPFEQPRDLGTDFIVTHALAMFLGVSMVIISVRAFYAGCLDCHEGCIVTLPSKKPKLT